MESLKELYKIGPGPSSSHTIGPLRACKRFKNVYSDADNYLVELFGSLSLTGKGHYTDMICIKTLSPTPTEVKFHSDFLEAHSNMMYLHAYKNGEEVGFWEVASIGGGSIRILNLPKENFEVYKENTFEEIYMYISENQISLVDYVLENEPDIMEYLEEVWNTMQDSIERGLSRDGVLPGSLKFPRMAKAMYEEALASTNEIEKHRNYVTAYAFAAAEENASCNEVVTAPTLGSCGVLPAVLTYYHKNLGYPKEKILEALAVAGVFGNIVKTNATISGAEGGCQAEIGVACAMASSAIAYLHDLPNHMIANAAEIGIEHHLGLTCDPVGGYVIIPCIERNGVAALRALDNAHYAKVLGKNKPNFVDFDTVVRTMKNTGMKIPVELKETSLAGLASEVKIY
ncbi:MAG: L-serine ammonia-lyase, iron-sulfur-dependent, subunit alpha [Erysipelotrichales bacterium]|nr:L-serine ammonia-lyase, iron-sulfur-dependent, subunit alpha [Erysipelotrichales bacterium]